MNTKEYTILSHCDITQLIEDVNRLLQDGWEVCGGVASTVRTQPNSEPLYMFRQAMLKTLKSE